MYNYKIIILESETLLMPILFGFFGLHALLFVIHKTIKIRHQFHKLYMGSLQGVTKTFFSYVWIAHIYYMFYRLVNL